MSAYCFQLIKLIGKALKWILRLFLDVLDDLLDEDELL